MADKPFLSVVMPVHAGAEWIEATLESVAAEPTDGLEILVIDSSPDDATAAIVERYADPTSSRGRPRPTWASNSHAPTAPASSTRTICGCPAAWRAFAAGSPPRP